MNSLFSKFSPISYIFNLSKNTFPLTSTLYIFSFIVSPCVTAQIIPQMNLSKKTVVKSVNNVHTISGGSQAESNLFHSFQEFNFSKNEVVHFSSPQSVLNIFARIGGGNPSKIDGLLSANGNANLFIMNPNGITFGPHARLDLGGSFVATTASDILFKDGLSFSGLPDEKDIPLLLINRPIGLLFNNEPKIIRNQSKGGLAVKPARDLALIGGNIILEGGNIKSSGGLIEIGAVGQDELVHINHDSRQNQHFSFNYNSVENFSDIQFSKYSILDIGSSGRVQVHGRNVLLSEGGRIQSINQGKMDAGKLNIQASEKLSLIGNTSANSPRDKRFALTGFLMPQRTAISSTTLGAGRSASIEIHTKSLVLTSGAHITAATDGVGKGGDISIVTNSLEASGQAPLLGLVRELVPFDNPLSRDFLIDQSLVSQIIGRSSFLANGGAGGSVKVTTENLNLRKGAAIGAGSNRGKGGAVRIDATDTIKIVGTTKSGRSSSNIITATTSNNAALDIIVNAKNLILLDGGILSTTTVASGDGGDIKIHASNLTEVSGTSSNGLLPSRILAGTFGLGKSGNLSIKTKDLLTTNGGQISSSTFGPGKSGNIFITSNTLKSINGGQILSSTIGSGDAGNIEIDINNSIELLGLKSGVFVNTSGSGTGGSITLSTNTLHIADKAVIDARTTKSGKSGDIFISSKNAVFSDGGKVIAASENDQTAGNIIFEGQGTLLLDGSDTGLFANTTTEEAGGGAGGNIMLDSRLILLRNQAGIGVDTQGEGQGGDINIKSNNLILDDNAFISAETDSGKGGNITLDISDLTFTRDSSSIKATAGEEGGSGDGGNINIQSAFLITNVNGNNDILANAFSGNGGSISIDAQGVLGFQLTEKPTAFSDINASSQLGLQGSVSINTPVADPTQGLVELPSNVLDSSSLNKQTCSSVAGTKNRNLSELFVTAPQKSITVDSDKTFQEDSTISSWIPYANQSNSLMHPTNQITHPMKVAAENVLSDSILEAEIWVQLPDGKLALSILGSGNQKQLSRLKRQNC